MKVSVTKAMPAVKDGEIYPTKFVVGDVVEGNLADEAIAGGWGEPFGIAQAAPAGGTGLPVGDSLTGGDVSPAGKRK